MDHGSVPLKDVAPTAASIEGVELLDLDHLGAIIERNLSRRERHRPAADVVVANAVAELELELGRRAAVPLITALVDHAELVPPG